MSQSVKLFNGLNGTRVTREALQNIISIARQEEQTQILSKLENLLKIYDDEKFDITLREKAFEIAPISMLNGIDFDEYNESESNGLAKPISPNEIYDMVTNIIIENLEKPLDNWEQEWGSDKDGYLYAYNFVTKKPYRSVNQLILNPYLIAPIFPVLQNPYFLTFKQIEDLGGKVKKGSKGKIVTYYSFLYSCVFDEIDVDFKTYDREKFINFVKQNKVLEKLKLDIPIEAFTEQSAIAFLKYYKVFNGVDVEGIDFDLDNFTLKGKLQKIENHHEKLPTCEAIIEAYPEKKPEFTFGGDSAYFSPMEDRVNMPNLSQYNYVQAYYTTFFHELIHSTGIESRLHRDLSGKMKSKNLEEVKKYAFEEFIAEIGAMFLSSYAGILHFTVKNSLAYVKGYRSRLIEILKEDNKFVFKASSQSQKAVDYLLQNVDFSNIKPVKEAKKETKDGLFYRVFTIHKDDKPATDFEFIKEREKARDIFETEALKDNSEIVTWEKNTYKNGKIIKKEDVKLVAFPKAKPVESYLSKFNIICERELRENFFEDTKHRYQLGDKWRNDFDYKGMFIAGTGAHKSWGVEKLTKLHESFVDVNYHEASKPLFKAISHIEEVKTEPKRKKENPKATNFGKKRKHESKAKNYPFSKDDVPFETGRRAYYWTSFDPEKRAKQEQDWYFEKMQSVYDKYLPVAKEKGLSEKFLNLFEKFNKGYLKLKLSELSARSNTASTAITGGSNFNVSRNEKMQNRHRAKLEEIYAFEEKYKKYFKDLLFPEYMPIKSGKANTLQRLEEKLLELEERHAKMVKANAELRKIFKKNLSKEDTILQYAEYLKNNGFTDKEIKSISDFAQRQGVNVLSFYTTNSSAEIRRIKQRIETEKKLQKTAEIKGDSDKFYFNGGYVYNDYAENRVKIHFDEKPSEEIRSFLKKSGQNYKWSPFNKVWQRQLNTYYNGNKKDLFAFLGVNENPDPTPTKKEPKADDSGQYGLFGAKKKKGLKEPVVNEVTETVKPKIATGSKAKSIRDIGQTENEFFTVNGEVGKFLQAVERKPFESVVITMDGEQGAGKTTTLYKFMDAFASAGNSSLFLSFEEHPESSLAVKKRNEYLSNEALNNIAILGEVADANELYSEIEHYDIIFIDSWQKLQRMVGAIRLDEDLRKKFDGKVFVVIFQQTTTGRTKGGAEVVFDGDIIIKMVKENSFADNYAYFDKNRYTKVPIETIRYNIANGTVYNPQATETQNEPVVTPVIEEEPIEFSFEVN